MDLCEGYILMKINQIEKLYHGTNQKFDAFDFNKAKNFKDFGKGYYLTTDFNQAQKWAQKRGDKAKKAYIYCYDVADVQTDSLKILELLQCDQKWLEFISENRIEGREPDYDIIYDRIADNQYLEISNTLLDYKQSRISSEEAIERIRWKNTKADQYCFKSKEALDLLRNRAVIVEYKDDSGKWIKEKLGG